MYSRLEASGGDPGRGRDGELFYIIENGVRFTGMRGWWGGSPAAVGVQGVRVGERAVVHGARAPDGLRAVEVKLAPVAN